jgi:hypothetical protein
LYDILKYKYNIQAIYDPCCSYPGIQCKFYYNYDLNYDKQNGMQLSAANTNIKDKKEKAKANAQANINVIEVSFMIFRTGSVLIVGMCEENILNDIYGFLTNLLKTEFENICQGIIKNDPDSLKDKKKKVRRKTIMITTTTNENNIILGPSQEPSSIYQKEHNDLPKDHEEVLLVDPLQIRVKRSYKKKNKPIL